jgi:Uma2 family endonuclease
MALARITWQDVQQLPDDGNRYEAIDGELCVTPAPSLRHQRILMRLTLALHNLLVEPGHGELFFAPTGVEDPERKLYNRQGVSVYWIVDPDARAVEVWTFGTEPGHGRFTDLLPVTIAGEQVGEIDLAEVFGAG